MKTHKKINLYLDADDTILKSTKTVVDILNKRYNINPPKREIDAVDWEYHSIYPHTTRQEIEQIYASDEFFSQIELDPVFKNFYEKHLNDFNYYIVTRGTEANIARKKELFSRIMPNATYIGLCIDMVKKGYSASKASVDMTYGVQIDDGMECLHTNANVKILQRNHKNLPWNQIEPNMSNLYVAQDWSEIVEILEFALAEPDALMEVCK